MRLVAQVMRNERTQRPEVGSGTHFGASNSMGMTIHDYTSYQGLSFSAPDSAHRSAFAVFCFAEELLP